MNYSPIEYKKISNCKPHHHTSSLRLPPIRLYTVNYTKGQLKFEIGTFVDYVENEETGHVMISNMSKEYRKKCSSCQTEIIMSDASGKWSVLETDNATIHRCKKQQQQQAQQITPPKAIENNNPLVLHTNTEKIMVLEKRPAAVESWIKISKPLEKG